MYVYVKMNTVDFVKYFKYVLVRVLYINGRIYLDKVGSTIHTHSGL
jgi:hypothetical protein